jgi:triacylglycerol esterase/lipase EstA (alpha/beta hydrolase family)
MLRHRVLAVAIAALVATGVAAAPAAAAPPPPGANDRSCAPSAAHPRPVVLVHGTFENRWNNWQALSPLLKADGYCVYALDYGSYLLKFRGASEVRTLVGVFPSNHGTTLNGLFLLPGSDAFAASCPACRQQKAGSAFLQQLNAGGDTVAGVTYTVIQTRYDEVVTPYSSAFLSRPAVTNILLQDQDPANRAEHVTIPYDPLALADVLAALR